MKPEKALQLLKQRQAQDRPHAEADIYKARQLSIEALEFRQRWEEQEGEDDFPLLPSEDPE